MVIPLFYFLRASSYSLRNVVAGFVIAVLYVCDVIVSNPNEISSAALMRISQTESDTL